MEQAFQKNTTSKKTNILKENNKNLQYNISIFD